VEYFNLYGISFKVDGDIKKARERAYLANKLMFQTKMQNVNELDIISNSLRLDDGTIVNVMSQHGLDTANIYVPFEEVLEPQYRESTVVSYWPAFNAHDADRDFIGVIVCRGGGFRPPYEFIPTDEVLPTDRPNNVDFVEDPEKRIWEYNGKKYTDIMPGKYTPEQTVMDAPNNVSTLTWQTELGVVPCCDPPDMYAFAGYYNEYERSQNFNHRLGVTFGPSSYPKWPSVPWEGSNPAYAAPKEFTLNLLDAINFYSYHSGAGETKFIDRLSIELGDTCAEGQALALAEAEALYDSQYEAAVFDPDSPTNTTRSLTGDDFGTWRKFYDTGLPTYGDISKQIHSIYTTTQKGFGTWDWLYGSIQDENHFALFYDTREWENVISGSLIFVGDWHDCITTQDCSDPCNISPIPSLQTDVNTQIIIPKIGFNNFVFNIEDYPEILGMGLDLPYNTIFDVRARYYQDEGFEIGLYWIHGGTWPAMISNYVATTADGELITIALTDNNPWVEHYDFPGVVDGDGNPVFIDDYGNMRLIKEEITIQEKLNPATGLWEEI